VLNNTWTGNYGTGYWGGTSGGSTPNQIPNTNSFIWGHGGGILQNTIAINTALQQAGVQVEGYQYLWKIKNGNVNLYTQQPGIDPMEMTVDIYKADGSLYRTYTYDYGYSHDWTNHSGTELFPDSYLPPSFFGNMIISAEGDDSGYWAGWYGPEFNADQSYVKLIYSANPCYNNALYDPSCQGYAEAYAQKLYDDNCAANALYDTGCPGYAAAYFTQQCTIDVMYSENCPGYTDYILSITQEEDHHHEETTDEVVVVTDAEDIAEPEITGDPVVDSILGDLNESPTVLTEEIIINVATEEENAESSDGATTETNDEPNSESSVASTDDTVSEDKDTSKDEPTKKEKLKKAIAKKAANLANEMSNAASLEQQKKMQAQVLALINFTPGFNQYGFTISGGYYPDGQLYKSEQLPESRRGLRNGLAQQILHEKMINMQWER
jgi:hypothetical protein